MGPIQKQGFAMLAQGRRQRMKRFFLIFAMAVTVGIAGVSGFKLIEYGMNVEGGR